MTRIKIGLMPDIEMLLDASNLYGWGMGHYLPYSRFKWLSQN